MGEDAEPQNKTRWQRALDPRFFDLMRWEVRHLRGRGQFGWQFALTLLLLGIVAAAWWIADLPERWSPQILLLRAAVDAATLSTPLRNEAPRIGQETGQCAMNNQVSNVLLAARRDTILLPYLKLPSYSQCGLDAGDIKSPSREPMANRPHGRGCVSSKNRFRPAEIAQRFGINVAPQTGILYPRPM